MDNWEQQDRLLPRRMLWKFLRHMGYRVDTTIEPYRELRMGRSVNLQSATKETLERVVEKGYVENEAQQILVSTVVLPWDFLQGKSVDSELRIRVEERQRDVGLFFPPLVGSILEWIKEGKENIIEKIKVLATGSGK